MKIRYMLLLVALGVMFNCNVNEKPIDYAIVQGTIANYDTSKSFVIKSYKQIKSHTLKIDEHGSFNDTIQIQNGEFLFLYKNKNIWLPVNQGDHVKMTLDGNDFFNTLSFEGVGSEEKNIKVELAKISNEENSNYEEKYNRDEVGFKQYITAYKNKKKVLLNEAKDLGAEFIKEQMFNIDYEFIYDLQKYPVARGRFIKNESFKPSDSFFLELNTLDKFNVDEFNRSGLYRVIVETDLRDTYKSTIKDESADYYLGLIDFISKNVDNQEIKNQLLLRNSSGNITYTSDLDGFYKAFNNASTDRVAKDSITKIYNQLKLLSKGSSSPKFVDYENHAGGTTSLDDLKGKYVYIDVWATWCGPCMAEIPSLKKIEKNYHGKNIEFISISVDRQGDYKKWKKMVDDKDLGGIQLFSDKSWSSEFVKGYLIKGIPRFILIDPSGNIVSANAPRPSDHKLINLFDDLSI
ncbi:TlpA family protein disulfide reductase [Tamlana haliotis]|uniref:TlpA family protein disulfide reductase n=1 Tax=Pseudotamlana haliotis TaxID=2614804 RepID=A0A6N6MC25_9FLAO|nr:TlpA disulfide reductase family protein [Tamlana haliotis]KAB1068158.1 TlpA family protein disulfide reductase [Tamlana haliotis]